MGLEQDGIPTVAVHTNIFARLCKATALSMGAREFLSFNGNQPALASAEGLTVKP